MKNNIDNKIIYLLYIIIDLYRNAVFREISARFLEKTLNRKL